MYTPFFSALTRIVRLEFEARSGVGSRMGWNHRGSGSVAVTVDGRDVHFVDRFVLDNGMPFEDRKCWRFTDEGIIFRHHRQQQFQDILLLSFDAEQAAMARPSATPSSKVMRLQAQAPYLCPPDRYDGSLLLHEDGCVVLRLRIHGARKDEHIRYTYMPANAD